MVLELSSILYSLNSHMYDKELKRPVASDPLTSPRSTSILSLFTVGQQSDMGSNDFVEDPVSILRPLCPAQHPSLKKKSQPRVSLRSFSLTSRADLLNCGLYASMSNSIRSRSGSTTTLLFRRYFTIKKLTACKLCR